MIGRFVRPGFAAVSWVALTGCAIPVQMLASPDDFTDYRAFRVASEEGSRLARAQVYLESHPRGRWAQEVRLLFDAEERNWFEASKVSRARARDYVVDLPHGPHAEAARALLVLFDQRESDIGTLELLAASRRTEVLLELQSAKRRRVGEIVLEELAALMDPASAGTNADDPPPPMAAVLRGPVARTWGGGRPKLLRDDRIFFGLPTPAEAQARIADIRFRLEVDRGRILGGRIEGEDLFVRWTEADAIRVLDASAPADREVAAHAVAEVLAGALEARFPAPRCSTRPRAAEIVARACDGWHVSARMGKRAGDVDVIFVRGPRRPR